MSTTENINFEQLTAAPVLQSVKKPAGPIPETLDSPQIILYRHSTSKANQIWANNAKSFEDCKKLGRLQHF